MARGADAKLRLTAQDRMSKHIKAVSNAFPRLTKAVRKTSLEMKKLERMNRGYNRLLSKTGKKMKSIGMNATIGLTAPIAALGAASLRTAVEFDKSMNRVQSLTGATSDEMKKMRGEITKLAIKTKFSFTETADAMAFLGQAGFKVNDIISATPAILSLAAASNTDLARSADIASNIMGAFGIEAKNMNRVADVLALTTASSNVNLEMMAETMQQAAPIAKMYGLTIEETSAMAGLLGNVGIQGSVAATSMKNAMLKLTAPTSKAKDLMKELGVKAVDPATGKMRKMNNILQDLGNSFKAKGIGDAKKLAVLNEIFGLRAIAGAGELLTKSLEIGKDGKNAITRFTDSLNDASKGAKGAAERMAEINQQGLAGVFDRLASAFQAVQLEIFQLEFGGKKLSKIIVEWEEKITGFLRELATTNRAMLKWGVIIGGILAVIGPLIGFLGIIATILPTMITGFGMMAAALKFVVAPLMIFAKFGAIALTVLKGIGIAVLAVLSPVLLLKAAVVALVVGLVNLALRWNKIKNAFTGPGGGLIKGTKTFFGFGDDEESKIPQFNHSPQGRATETKEALQQSRENKAREAKASLAIQFSGDRQGTKIFAEDRDGIIDGMTGAMGTL